MISWPRNWFWLVPFLLSRFPPWLLARGDFPCLYKQLSPWSLRNGWYRVYVVLLIMYFQMMWLSNIENRNVDLKIVFCCASEMGKLHSNTALWIYQSDFLKAHQLPLIFIETACNVMQNILKMWMFQCLLMQCLLMLHMCLHSTANSTLHVTQSSLKMITYNPTTML